MDPELKQLLQGMETRLMERVAAVEKRIDDRINTVDANIGTMDERLGSLEERIMLRVDGRIDAVEERLKDFIREADRDLETKLIAEFWKWGRTSDLRTKQVLSDVGALNERMVAVEDRISALERRQ